MTERSINDLMDSNLKYVDAVHYQRLQVALREARAFLEDMTKHCYGPRSVKARDLLKKWKGDD